VFETEEELSQLQELLEASSARVGERLAAIFDSQNRLSAKQLAGFQGVRLMAVATVNSKGEPRVAPRSAAFLHGKFYLASNSKSVTVRRLSAEPSVAVSYFENHLLIMGHGLAVPILEGTSGFMTLAPEWEEAFRGGEHPLQGTDMLVRIDASHLVAFAAKPGRYPEAWKRGRP